MKEPLFQTRYLILVQRVTWRLLFICFLLATLFYLLEFPAARAIAFWSVIALLALTLIKIVILSEQFRAVRLYRIWLLGYVLLVILVASILLRVCFAL